jgi:hypothetical protein
MDPVQLSTAFATDIPPYVRPPVTTVREVLERLDEIQAYAEENELLGPNDGLACFNRLYRSITASVLRGLGTRRFRDPDFVATLDVSFANRYLSTVRASVTEARVVAGAWRVLIERRDDPRIHPIQFAAAGVNAHVDLDLAVAVAATCVKMRSEPTSGKKHRDYLEINRIFAEQMRAFRESYEQGPAARLLDGIAAPFLDLASDAAMAEARALAWKRAVELWALREKPMEESVFVERLDDEAQVTGLLLFEPVL